MTSNLWFWFFNVGILLLLGIDLLLLRRNAKTVTLRAAAVSSAVWVGLALLFNAAVWHWKGPVKGLEFLTGYIVEYALSVDNVFVFLAVFAYFKVEPRHQHRVLFWGILGAILMRGVMIFVGVRLVTRFSWLLYIFGAALVWLGLKMALNPKEEVNPEKNLILKLCRRWLPVTDEFHGSRFLVRQSGAIFLTPLALVLVMLEVMDLVFAIDSIPAVFAVTRDPFIVYSSNICAILGLRSMYFLLAHVVDRFVYLKYGLAAVLTFIGSKMLLAGVLEIPIGLSLGIVAGCLLISVAASLLRKPSA